MANPLRLFRKYQYISLVAFGIMLMFAFVVGPILSDFLQSSVGGGVSDNAVAMTWKGGEIREDELARMRTTHLLTTQFLQSLVERVEVKQPVAVKRKGETVNLIKGRKYRLLGIRRDDDGKTIFQILVAGEMVEVPQDQELPGDMKVAERITPRARPIFEAVGEDDLVQRTLLAAKAGEIGIMIDDQTVLEYLDNLYDTSPGDRPDYELLLAQATGGKLQMKTFLRQMQMELAAQRMLVMAQSGLYAGTPDQLSQCYDKLHRRVTAELLAVKVDDFIGQVPEPTDQEVKALYEEGKDRFSFPTSPDPGFKRRKKIAFGYMRGVFEDFIQREVEKIRPTITDEQIEARYEERKETQYKVVELPDEEDAQGPATKTPPTDGEPAAGDAAKTAPAKEAKEAEKAKKAKKKPAAAKEDTPASSQQEPAAGAKKTPAATPKTPAATPKTPAATPKKPAATKKPESQPDAKATDPKGDGNQPAGEARTELRSGAVSWVSYQDESSPPLTDGKGDGTAASNGSDDKKPAAQNKPAADEKPEPAKKPAPEPRYKPLDDALRAEIRAGLAREQARDPAQEQLETAVNAVRTTIEKYAHDLSRAKILQNVTDPEPLDMRAIAAAHNLAYQTTPLLDSVDMTELRRRDPVDDDPPYAEFIRATETVFGQQTGMIRRTIIDVGYNGDAELYVPRRLVQGLSSPGAFQIPPEELFLYWRIEEVPEVVPSLDKIRGEVVKACKRRKALPLAEKKARQMSEKASSQAGKSLREVFPESAASVIVTTPFSWMTLGAVPAGSSARPTLSPVNGTANGSPVNVAAAGNDFMAAVFKLKVDEVGVAVDQPKAYVYVARVAAEDRTEEQRRATFFAAGLTDDVQTLVQMEQANVVRGWYEEVEREFNISWKRDPVRNWDRR